MTLRNARCNDKDTVNSTEAMACHLIDATYIPCKAPPPLHGATAPSGPGSPQHRGFTITLRRTTLGMTPLDE